MKFFLDSANLEAFKKYKNIIDGATTNPLIMAKEGATQETRLKEICDIVPNIPISGEVVYAHSVEQVCADARKIAAIAPNIVVKIPGNMVGLLSIRLLKAEGMKLNVTALMTFRQLAFAAQQGADYVSQFYCRGKDAGLNSTREINMAREFIDQNNLPAQIIMASLRSPADIEQVLLARGHIITITPELIELAFTHSKTQPTIEEFAKKYEDSLLNQIRLQELPKLILDSTKA